MTSISSPRPGAYRADDQRTDDDVPAFKDGQDCPNCGRYVEHEPVDGKYPCTARAGWRG